MARAKTVVAPVASQASILALVAAAMSAEPHYAMLTADEIALAGAENVEVNGDIQADGKTAVRLSAAGQALASNPATVAPAPTPAAKPSFVIEDAIPVPSVKTGGGAKRESIYPFDQLGVNQSFFVAASTDMPEPAKSLASTVSSATARYRVETGETEIVEETIYAKGADGKNAKGADGKWIKTGTKTVTRNKMKVTRQFVIRAVEGGARIWRTA